MYTHCIIFFTYFCGAGVLLYGPPGTGELFFGESSSLFDVCYFMIDNLSHKTFCPPNSPQIIIIIMINLRRENNDGQGGCQCYLGNLHFHGWV